MKLSERTFQPRPFDPEQDVPSCFMIASDKGRILSRAIMVPDTRVKQFAPACKPNGSLPTKRGEFALTLDTRLVTCPKCCKTAAFLEAFESQTGLVYDADKIAHGVPLDEAVTPEDSSPPTQ